MGLRAVCIIALAPVLAACVPDQLDQPQSGDGWRLIGWNRGGKVRPPAAGEDAVGLLGELGLLRMSGANDPSDPATEVDFVLTHAVSGSCPQVRFDGFDFDPPDGGVQAQITDREDLFSLAPIACSADANPVAFWVAVQRDRLPDGPFELRTDEAPDVRTLVDLGN